MADEPVGTSTHYAPFVTYTPPVGRLPILGKARAEVDRLRAEAANAFNMALNRDLEQANNDARSAAEIAALNTRVINETALNDAQVLHVQGQTANEATQTVNDTTRTTNDTNKTNAEVTAIGISSTNDTNRAVQEVAESIQKTLNDTQRTSNDSDRAAADVNALNIKSVAEVGLLEQKTATELGHTSDVIPTDIGIDSTGLPRTLWNGAVAVGMVGEQRALINKQKEGFDRDAEQKLTKIVLDSWSVRATSGLEDPLSDEAGVSDADVKDIVNKAREGLGISQT
jgi:hypothetical protein